MTNPIPECSDEVAALRAQVARLSEALGKFCAPWIVCTCRQSIHPALGLDPSCNYHNWHDEIDAGRKASPPSLRPPGRVALRTGSQRAAG